MRLYVHYAVQLQVTQLHDMQQAALQVWKGICNLVTGSCLLQHYRCEMHLAEPIIKVPNSISAPYMGAALASKIMSHVHLELSICIIYTAPTTIHTGMCDCDQGVLSALESGAPSALVQLARRCVQLRAGLAAGNLALVGAMRAAIYALLALAHHPAGKAALLHADAIPRECDAFGAP